MKRIGAAAIAVSLAALLALPAASVSAQTVQPATRLAQAAPADASPSRHHLRPPSTRLHVTPRFDQWPDDVYPRYDPGPTAVRVCSATYVQEYRPSGTVIVPRMSCHWQPG